MTKRATDNLSVYTMELLAILLAAERGEEVRPEFMCVSERKGCNCMRFCSACIG